MWHLHWAPETFWKATPVEMMAAFEAADTNRANKDRRAAEYAEFEEKIGG